MQAISRRAFLGLAAGGGATADLGLNAFDKLIPYVTPPEETQPGVWSHYATTCRECPAGCGILVRHRDGRMTPAAVTLRPNMAELRIRPPETLGTVTCDLWVWPSAMLFDGRGANRGWLEEAPDPVSTIAWGNGGVVRAPLLGRWRS